MHQNPDPDDLTEICTSLSADGQLARDLLDRIGDKWSVLIIASLRHGPVRFTAIQQAAAGISQRMLTLNLRQLQRDGLISRTSYPEVPPRVEYELTDLGVQSADSGPRSCPLGRRQRDPGPHPPRCLRRDRCAHEIVKMRRPDRMWCD
jgi:DNA-binding HxlR family transcriptional regulator